MRAPLVSVIVAVYNQERYIGRCLRSLLNQSMNHDNYEVIVVDDGSTDLTSYALTQFCDPSDSVIRVLTNDKNNGLPHAVNRGIQAALGEYIVRVDSDDFVNRNCLLFLHEYMLGNPQVDAAACDYLLMSEDEEVIERRSSAKDPIACGIMFRKEDLIRIGLYNEDFLAREEEELRIRYEKEYKIGHLDMPLYRYRQHLNSLTQDEFKMRVFKKRLEDKYGDMSKQE